MGDLKTNLARAENNKRNERTREAMAKNIQLARDGKPSPLGAWLPSWIRFNFDTRQYDVDNEKAEIIKRIFTLYNQGKGGNAITKILNQEGVKSFASKKVNGWTRGSIAGFLKMEGVIGTLPINGERIAKAYPAVISEKLFYAVQSKLKNNKVRHGNYSSDNVLNLFRGICYCPHCGHSIKVRKVASGSMYYFCTGHHIGVCKIKNNVRSEEIESEFLQWFIPHSKEILLGNGKEQSALDTLKAKFEVCNRHIEETMALWDKGLKLSQVETRLLNLQSQREAIEKEITTEKTRHQEKSNLPSVYAELDTLIEKGLTDNETRKRIASIVPTIVKEVKMDLRYREKPSFKATLHNGAELEWDYDIDEFKQEIKWFTKDGQWVLGSPKVIEGKWVKTK